MGVGVGEMEDEKRDVRKISGLRSRGRLDEEKDEQRSFSDIYM